MLQAYLLFPLNSRRQLRRNIIGHAPHIRNFIEILPEIVSSNSDGRRAHRARHEVEGLDNAQDDHPRVAARVTDHINYAALIFFTHLE